MGEDVTQNSTPSTRKIENFRAHILALCVFISNVFDKLLTQSNI